ncbi:MAG: hypothetical protein Greene041639_499 [Parcubacteria group bacterium Greene0416_39]|nr:MAG: hypothetical protein Greene041639_499 [Parcubacteria group bacterium Greene0416_39]TSC97636.1 MAG: hypothetical protein Greene101447_383 [Parcubacteria group bacterium Greene1014_47]
MIPFVRTIFPFLFLLVAILLSFGAGFSIGKDQAALVPIEGVSNIDLGKPTGADFSLFWDAWRTVQEQYVARGELNFQDMIYGAISGMVSSLEDPYTVFLNPEDSKRFSEDVSGVFEGVGMEIGIRQKQLRVISPLEGTPAQKAGLRPGDRILKINDTSTENMTVEKAVSLIRGPKGTNVTFSILREGWNESKEFTIERAVIQVPSLKWELKEGNIAYVKLNQFSAKAGRDFAKAAGEILASSAKKIVLDLRNNPGGYLEVSQDIAGWFLAKGSAVVIEDFGKEGKQQVYQARGNPVFVSYPMVVLINEGSASASEILAGALRDGRGITLIGEKSFGKGSVQELKELKDRSALKVTVAKWLTPKGESISDKGLEPDIVVKMDEKDVDEKRDPQLEKALEVVGDL